MREDISSIIVTTYTLECTPYSRKCCEEAKETRVGRIALRGVAPFVCVETEEKLDILEGMVS